MTTLCMNKDGHPCMPGFTVCGCCYTPDAEDCIRIEKEKARQSEREKMEKKEEFVKLVADRVAEKCREQEAEIARLKEGLPTYRACVRHELFTEIEKAIREKDINQIWDEMHKFQRTLRREAESGGAALNPQKEKRKCDEPMHDNHDGCPVCDAEKK